MAVSHWRFECTGSWSTSLLSNDILFTVYASSNVEWSCSLTAQHITVQEGIYLFKHDINPYSGGSFRHVRFHSRSILNKSTNDIVKSPLLLSVFTTILPSSRRLASALWTLNDVSGAYALVRIWRSRQNMQSSLRDTLVAASWVGVHYLETCWSLEIDTSSIHISFCRRWHFPHLHSRILWLFCQSCLHAKVRTSYCTSDSDSRFSLHREVVAICICTSPARAFVAIIHCDVTPNPFAVDDQPSVPSRLSTSHWGWSMETFTPNRRIFSVLHYLKPDFNSHRWKLGMDTPNLGCNVRNDLEFPQLFLPPTQFCSTPGWPFLTWCQIQGCGGIFSQRCLTIFDLSFWWSFQCISSSMWFQFV